MRWSLEALLAVAALLVTVAVYLAARANELRVRRADLLRAYTTEFYAAEGLRQLFMDILYDRFSVDGDFYGTGRELDLIHLLDHLNAVGYNCHQRVLRFADVAPSLLGYVMLRTWDNDVVREYLQHIETEDQRGGYGAVSGFPYFERVARRLAALKD